MARLRVVLRRAGAHANAAPIRVGGIEIDEQDHVAVAHVGGGRSVPLQLTLTEFRLLACLASQPRRCFSRGFLIEHCLPESDALERVIDSHISAAAQAACGRAGRHDRGRARRRIPSMARKLDRIWIRFGLAVSVTMTLMLAVLAGTQVMFWKIEHREFQQSLPVEVRAELDDLRPAGARAQLGEYWAVDPMRGEARAAVHRAARAAAGPGVRFFISKVITLPLDSMAAAATRVALGISR